MKTALVVLLSAFVTFNSWGFAHAGDDGAFSPLKLDGHVLKWGQAKLGTPAHVRYAFVDRPIVQNNARNCEAMDDLDLLSQTSGIKSDTIRAEAKVAFRQWEAVSGITFEETQIIAEADILIGVQARPRGFAFTNVFYETDVSDIPRSYTRGGDRALSEENHEATRATSDQKDIQIAALTKTSICLNPAHQWKIGFDGDLDTYDLRYTFAHEIGHAIGLDHYLRQSSIMHFKYREAFHGLQPSDIAGAQWLYGPPRLTTSSIRRD